MTIRLRLTVAAVLMPATLIAVCVPAVAASAAPRPTVRIASPGSPSGSEATTNRPAPFRPVKSVTASATKPKPKPKPKKAQRRTAPVSRYRSLPARVMSLNWHGLAMCEAGGRPNAVSSNGLYRGMYQFSVGTWHSVGGVGLPDRASKDEQTYRAQLLFMRRGTSPWPMCGSRLFR